MKVRFVAAILVSGVMSVVVGCGGAKPEAKGAAAAPSAQAAQPKTASAGGEIGIPECDTYMTKYRECIEVKVPDSVKGTMRQSFDDATKAWKEAAKTPAAREGLAQACRQATDAARTAMQSFGCTF